MVQGVWRWCQCKLRRQANGSHEFSSQVLGFPSWRSTAADDMSERFASRGLVSLESPPEPF
jgi:hypothetical protein